MMEWMRFSNVFFVVKRVRLKKVSLEDIKKDWLCLSY